MNDYPNSDDPIINAYHFLDRLAREADRIDQLTEEADELLDRDTSLYLGILTSDIYHRIESFHDFIHRVKGLPIDPNYCHHEIRDAYIPFGGR